MDLGDYDSDKYKVFAPFWWGPIFWYRKFDYRFLHVPKRKKGYWGIYVERTAFDHTIWVLFGRREIEIIFG